VDVIPVLRPQLPAAESLLPYLRRIDGTRFYTNWGPLCSELEQRLSAHFSIQGARVVSASSGSAALIGAILATAGRADTDRPVAIVPAFTFIATASAVEQCGYSPYLVDVRADDWALDATTLSGHALLPRTGVVVVVSPFGRPVPQGPWRAFQRNTGIPVVIDGAAQFEALGTNPEQLIGEVPVSLSFHATKSFATGEGGCVVTTDPGLAARVTESLNFGFFENRDSHSASINGKMSEYHAAVGLAELDAWPAKAQAFQTTANNYRAQLRRVGLADRLIAAPAVAGCYILFQSATSDEADGIQRSLSACGVDFRLWYGRGLHTQPHFSGTPHDQLPITADLAPRLLGLPMAPDLSDVAISQVVGAVAAAVAVSR